MPPTVTFFLMHPSTCTMYIVHVHICRTGLIYAFFRLHKCLPIRSTNLALIYIGLTMYVNFWTVHCYRNSLDTKFFLIKFMKVGGSDIYLITEKRTMKDLNEANIVDQCWVWENVRNKTSMTFTYPHMYMYMMVYMPILAYVVPMAYVVLLAYFTLFTRNNITCTHLSAFHFDCILHVLQVKKIE